MNNWNPKSSFKKRMELNDAIFSTDFNGSVEGWLQAKGFDIEEITDVEIERFIDEIKAIKNVPIE